jgi:uncharacterized membrane protein
MNMNKKGFSDKELIRIITTIAGLLLVYVAYKAIIAKLGGG